VIGRGPQFSNPPPKLLRHHNPIENDTPLKDGSKLQSIERVCQEPMCIFHASYDNNTSLCLSDLPPSITEVPDFRVVNQGWKSPPPPSFHHLPLPIPFGTENKTKGPEQNPKTQNSLNKDNDIYFIYL